MGSDRFISHDLLFFLSGFFNDDITALFSTCSLPLLCFFFFLSKETSWILKEKLQESKFSPHRLQSALYFCCLTKAVKKSSVLSVTSCIYFKKKKKNPTSGDEPKLETSLTLLPHGRLSYGSVEVLLFRKVLCAKRLVSRLYRTQCDY